MENNSQKKAKSYSDLTFEEVKSLAEKGDAEAQCRLAIHYEKGEGIEKDIAKALEWYTKSANQGYHWSQYNLGACFYHGKGVRKN